MQQIFKSSERQNILHSNLPFSGVADEWKANVPQDLMIKIVPSARLTTLRAQGFELSLEADASDWEWVGGVLNAAYEVRLCHNSVHCL